MGKDITIIQMPAEVNKLYCPKCGKVRTGRNKAYVEIAFTNEDDFAVHNMLYNDNPFEKDEVKCMCPVCKNRAMGIYSEFASEFVEEIISKKWTIIGVTNEVNFDTTGSVAASVHKPLVVAVKIPEAKTCTNSINISNPDYSVEWIEDTMYEITANNHSLHPGVIVYDISTKIHVEKRRCWYHLECAEYIKTIRSKGYICIAYEESVSKDDEIYNDSSIFAAIDIMHCNIIDTINGIDIPYGVEIILNYANKISIKFKRYFDLDTADTWFASLAEKIPNMKGE